MIGRGAFQEVDYKQIERVERTEDFPAAFERAQRAGVPAVIELLTDPPQITPAKRLTKV